MDWTEYKIEDSTTWPTKRGQYLVIYEDSSGLDFYMICYYWNNQDGKIGFYYDENCQMGDTLLSKWNFRVKSYIFLRNLLSTNGDY